MASVKISISLDEADVAYLDAERLSGHFATRSAAIQAALKALRESRLTDAYAEAFAEWDDTAWDAATGDGIGAA